MSTSLTVSRMLEVIKQHGYQMMLFYAHAYKFDEGDHEHETLEGNLELEREYTSCWYGGEFFEDLLMSKLQLLRETNQVVADRIYSGYLEGDEVHYFTVITTDDQAYVINSYGGTAHLELITHPISHFNLLLKSVNNETFERTFGFKPLSKMRRPAIISLREYLLILPSPRELNDFMRRIVDAQRNPIDRAAALRLNERVNRCAMS